MAPLTSSRHHSLLMIFCTISLTINLCCLGSPAIGGTERQAASKLDQLATEAHLIDAVKFGEDVIDKSKRMETTIADSRVRVAKGSVSYAQLIDGYPTPSTQKQDYVARTILKATSHFVNSYCKPHRISSYECGLYLAGKQIPRSKSLEKCSKIVRGKAFADEYRRLLPASYSDGIYNFRKSVAGGELPHPRSVSSKFHGTFGQVSQDHNHNVALVQWSQFIEHDLAQTTVQSMHDGTDIECCSVDHALVKPRYLHPSCKPLSIDENDAHYKAQHVTCLNYVRSALSLGNECHFGPANQLNQATGKLDLSQLYGSHRSEMAHLRSNNGGKLRSQSFDSVDYLVEKTDRSYCLSNASFDTICYESGDSRVNVNPYITLLHTLFLRSHNRLAKLLSTGNPSWSNERLFEMAQKLNIRIYQNIVRDWAETVLGSPLDLDAQNDARDERVSNEFATAAIRFYNTMMPGEIANGNGQQNTALELGDLFYKPKDLRKKEYFSHLVQSVLGQNAMSLDTNFVDDLAQLLFQSQNVGSDVLALDIQRGRDHGLNGYTRYYELCNGRRITSWSDLAGLVKPEDLLTLQSAYRSVHDVDLIIGAIAEKPATPQTLVGPTLACIIRDQITASLAAAAPSQQVQTPGDDDDAIDAVLANYSATRFICDTARVEQVQQNIFRLPAPDNPLVRCAQLPPLDLSALRQQP